jgi:hypothetical protein
VQKTAVCCTPLEFFWVLDRTLRILFGDVSQVVKGIRQTVTKRGLIGAKRKTLCGVADSV